jgi:amidase
MMKPLWTADATELVDMIRSKQVSCTEVMTSVVERIRALNPELNAIVYDLGDDALVAARDADDALANGDDVGPLHGIPVTIKVNIDVDGQPTTNGLPALADLIAPGDSPLVANLRRAGAIIVGRTNTPELSMRFTTVNPLHGRTYNPWDRSASAGGSSGGAAAAAAAGFGPIHHGNDIAGSLRAPAYCCGVVTIKPTQGRIPAFSPSATAERGFLSTLMSTQGAIARSVADVRLGTRVMAMRDPRDPWWVPAPFDGEPLPTPIRVAVTRNGHGHPVHPGIAALVDRTAGLLSDAGYDVVEVEPPPITDAARAWFSTGITELKLTLDPAVRAHGTDDLKTIFDRYYAMGEILDLAGYRAGLSDRTRLARQWNVFLEDHPLVLTPYLLCATFAQDGDLVPETATRQLFEAAIYSYGVNLLGLPAGMVPIDLVEGLPAGVQLIGRRYREDVVLDAMAAIEARAGRLVERLWSRTSA